MLGYKFKKTRHVNAENQKQEANLESKIGEFDKFSKSPFVNFCKFMLHMEKKLEPKHQLLVKRNRMSEESANSLRNTLITK